MDTLTDLPRLAPRLGLLSVHGFGRGGGEVVAGKIIQAYAAKGQAPAVMSAAAGLRAGLKAVARVEAGLEVLLTAGPRDLPYLLACRSRRRQCLVYLQVPYAQALTWRDPLHAMVVLVYLLAVTLLAIRVFANSRASAAGIPWRRVDVLWPVTRAELQHAAARTCPTPPPLADPTGVVIHVVCRLARERGRGARDMDALVRLLRECREGQVQGAAFVRVEHFGDCTADIRALLQHEGGSALTFHGFRKDWLSSGHGPVVLLSRYEGFGLAAFEAASAGRTVFVNEAFPDDLLQACTTIRRIRTGQEQPVLPQLVLAW